MRTAWAAMVFLLVGSVLSAVPADAGPKYFVVEHGILFIECGVGLPLFNGDGSMACATFSPNHRSRETWSAAEDLNTMVVEAQWSGFCLFCFDGRPWLQFRLASPSGTTFGVWSDPPSTTAQRYEFELTREHQDFVVGNWTVRVQPSPGDPSQVYRNNGGFMAQVRVDVYVTMAHRGYELPPDYTAIPA